jgi:DNA phosphorothioation-associated putative methyltransferase
LATTPRSLPRIAWSGADVVNLGYVINVIEDVSERERTLREAWALATRVLLVAARLNDEARQLAGATPHGDGFLTARDTFQKLYTQEELRAWIAATVGAQPVTAAPGIFMSSRWHMRSPLAANDGGIGLVNEHARAGAGAGGSTW